MEEQEPLITYRHNKNFGIIPIFYGFDTDQFKNIETTLRNELTKIAVEKGYKEIEMIDNNYSTDGWVIVHYRFELK